MACVQATMLFNSQHGLKLIFLGIRRASSAPSLCKRSYRIIAQTCDAGSKSNGPRDGGCTCCRNIVGDLTTHETKHKLCLSSNLFGSLTLEYNRRGLSDNPHHRAFGALVVAVMALPLKKPGGAKRSQEEPGGARRSQGEPGGALLAFLKRYPSCFF